MSESGAARRASPQRSWDEVTSFYGTGRRWGGRGCGYLFTDVFLQRAAAEYLAGNYQQVVMSLENRVDDPRALHLLGCASFGLPSAVTARSPAAMRGPAP